MLTKYIRLIYLVFGYLKREVQIYYYLRETFN